MNQTQKTYAIGRIDVMVVDEFAGQKSKHSKPAVSHDNCAKVAMLRAGTAKIRKNAAYDCQSGYRGSLRLEDVFDFSEKPSETNHAAVEKAMKPIRAKAQEAKDEIMLGDEERALNLLRAFEKLVSK